jgi:hypothetical protein
MPMAATRLAMGEARARREPHRLVLRTVATPAGMENSLAEALTLAAGIGFLSGLPGLEWPGSWAGRRASIAGGAKQDAARLQHSVGSMFALLTFLMGFTFGMAVERCERRGMNVVAEVNAIASAHGSAALVGTPAALTLLDGATGGNIVVNQDAMAALVAKLEAASSDAAALPPAG